MLDLILLLGATATAVPPCRLHLLLYEGEEEADGKKHNSCQKHTCIFVI